MAATTNVLRPAPKLPVAVEKPTPYTFDLGLLLANDPNPAIVASAAEGDRFENDLAAIARDGAQALVNQLLTTCRIEPTAADGVLLHLPPTATPLPREKPVPQPKPPTKWQQFAARKGITPKTREQRRNLQYNAASQTWERKWGFQRGDSRKAAAETDWLVEVKEKDFARDAEHAANGTSFRGDGRRERKMHAKRNERQMRRNEERAERSR